MSGLMEGFDAGVVTVNRDRVGRSSAFALAKVRSRSGMRAPGIEMRSSTSHARRSRDAGPPCHAPGRDRVGRSSAFAADCP